MAQLLIGSQDVTNRSLIKSVTVTNGRSSVTTQPQPANFSVELSPDIDVYSYFGGVEIGDVIDWYLDDPYTGGMVRVFHGEITDVNVRLDSWGLGQGIRTYAITALGLSAPLLRQNIDSAGFIKQYAGTRIYNCLVNEVSIDGGTYDVSGIETPAVYEIAAINQGYVPALELAQEAADSAMGVLFEDHIDGIMRYQSYTTRATNPVITLTPNDVLASSLVVNKTTTEIANSVTVSYGASGTRGNTYTDPYSPAIYGQKDAVKDTTLHNATDANTQAQIYLAARKQPLYQLQSISIDSAAVSASLKHDLLNAKIGTIIDIPDSLIPEVGAFKGFIEQITWSSDRGHDTVTFVLSNYGQMYPFTMWSDVANTITWQTWQTATTVWSDLI
ncbi:MAG: hypothetical protein EBW87_00985 [Burkholderiaceae bacterium]|nr:hypothetical protein [Burkholderiaceae bacterium]